MPYLTGIADNFEDLHTTVVKFLAGYGTVQPPTYSGTGTGTLEELDTYPATVSETWTVECTAASPGGGTFSVTGSSSGATSPATVGQLYDNGKVRFVILGGATDFVVGDTFTITTTVGVMPSAERWQVLRLTGVTNIQASSFQARWEPFAVFKGPYHNHANGWATATGQVTNQWLSWKMVNPLDITRLRLRGSATASQSPNTFTLQYSVDGVNWVDRKSWADITWAANETKEFAVDGVSPGPQLYWRIFVASNNGNTSNIVIQQVLLPEFMFTADFNHSRRPASWLKAPGLTGLDPCFINFQLYDRPTDDYYNLALTGATGFIGAADFDNQPGAREALGLTLWNQPIKFWLSANGQRVILTAKVDTVYVSMYAGKINTYGTPGQYPYPLLLAGPLATASATRYSGSIALPYKGNRGQMVLRDAGGVWRTPHAWPYTKSYGSTVTFRDVNGAYCLMPIVLHDNYNTYGTLDGLHFITGFGNAVENTLDIGGQEHVVLQDGALNGLADFFTQRIA